MLNLILLQRSEIIYIGREKLKFSLFGKIKHWEKEKEKLEKNNHMK